MSSVPERRPIIRGEQVFLRASERADLPLFGRWFNAANGQVTSLLHDECSFLPHRRSWEYD